MHTDYQHVVSCASHHNNMPLLFTSNSLLFNSAMSTFSERIAEAAKLAGGQAELARKLSEKIQRKVSQGLIGYLIHGRPDRSPPRSSEMTPWIAEIVGFNVEWLATGRGDKYQSHAPEQIEASNKPAEQPAKHFRAEDVASPHYHARTSTAATTPEASPEQDTQELVKELLGRRVPTHIQQSIMALLQTCDRLGPPPELSEWDKMTVSKIEALRASVPPEQQQVIDDFRDMFLHGHVQPGPKRDLIAVVSLPGDAADHDADDDPGHAEAEKQKRPK